MKMICGILIFFILLGFAVIPTITQINRELDKIMENELNKKQYD
jgi:hypothetical protein